MKFKLYAILAAFCLTLAACNDEDPLTPADNKDMSRFTFPQGNNSWDKDIEKIYEDFGVYIIYKDLTQADFNRTWTGGGGSKYKGQASASDEMTEGYVKFMKNHIFAYLNKKVTNKVLPMYWYLAYEVYTQTDLVIIPGVLEFHYKVPQVFLNEGTMDFWSTCMYGEPDESTGENFGTPSTKDDYNRWRLITIGYILDRAIYNGSIEVPAEFDNGFDHATSLTDPYDAYKDDPNYCLKRGYIGNVSLVNGGIQLPYSISECNDITLNFRNYVLINCKYTQEQIKQEYVNYPFAIQKFSYVYNYIKDNYQIDLNAIAEGPTDWDTCLHSYTQTEE